MSLFVEVLAIKPEELEALKAGLHIFSVLSYPEDEDLLLVKLPSEIREFLRSASRAQLRAVLSELIVCWYNFDPNR